MDLKQFAGRLNLSPTTVSRVLNGHGDRYRIARATQAKVLKAASASKFVVNQMGRGLRLGTSQTLGLIIPDISNPFFATLGRHVERAARAQGYSVLLADSQESVEVEVESFATMESRHVDGLIVAPVSGQGPSRKLFAHWGKPLVVVDRAPAELHAVSVVVDNFEAARQGILLLAASGHRAIGCIHGDSSSFSDSERIRGYHSAMKELGLRPAKSWVTGGDYSIESGSNGSRELLSSSKRPTAILAFGNLLALGALNAIREMHLRVPADVSMISFDEQPWAASMAPPLTTIAQPVERMGEMAAKLLLESLRSKSKRQIPRRIVLPFSILKRASILNLVADAKTLWTNKPRNLI